MMTTPGVPKWVLSIPFNQTLPLCDLPGDIILDSPKRSAHWNYKIGMKYTF